MSTPATSAVGWYFTALQFLFALSWTVYVIWLPALAAKVGIPRESLIWVLMADQAIFAVMDVVMGVMSDRFVAVYARLARALLALSLVSCAAFLVLPFVTDLGPLAFLALIFVWSVTSSALRVPPLVLIGRYTALPSQPWLASLILLGMGLSGAVSPYIAFELRSYDPAIPFVVSNLALALVTLGLTWAIGRLGASGAAAVPDSGPKPGVPVIAVFLFAALLAAFGFQLHSAINSVPMFLKFATPAQLEHLLPLFWVGFNLGILPASAWAKRKGAVTVMASAALLGALALGLAWRADSLAMLVAAQLAAGAAWSALLVSTITAALAFGHTGREGRINGSLFALLALAAFVRMGIVAGQLDASPDFSATARWLAPAAWVAAALLAVLAWRMLRTSRATGALAALIGARRAPAQVV